MKTMTSKQRMLTAMRNETPDRVPAAPDFSNMIPCRLTGKPFWDIYLYQDPPLWRAYIDAVNHFGTDGWLIGVDGFSLSDIGEQPEVDPDQQSETVIVEQGDRRIVTRSYTQAKGNDRQWSKHVTVYWAVDPPVSLLPAKIGMNGPPEKWWPIEGVKPQKKGLELFQEAKDLMGDRGVVGIWVNPPQLADPEKESGYSIFEYMDKYQEVKDWSIQSAQQTAENLERLLNGPVKPDFVLTGGSGLLIFNTPDILRDITLPALKQFTRICKEAGIPSQVHCCGPEMEVVEMSALETDLNSINPLEIRPMGDCDLATVKKQYGQKLGLMGNLHTTEVMLRGSVTDVRREALKAIRAAGENGGFILSTGDQCGRDTPDENIRELLRVAEEFGHYPLDLEAINKEIVAVGG